MISRYTESEARVLTGHVLAELGRDKDGEPVIAEVETRVLAGISETEIGFDEWRQTLPVDAIFVRVARR